MNYDQLLDKLEQDLLHNRPLLPDGWMTISILVAVLFFLLVAIVFGLSALSRKYRVWSSKKQGQTEMILADLEGQAALLRAHNEQQIQVAQAKGRLDAAGIEKQAEIIDAEAVAKSVEIIGRSLHENQGYLQWKWIHMMEDTENATIYIPTEAGLPILEAGKRPVK